MQDWYAVDLTNEQIERFGQQNNRLWSDLLHGTFDTVNREQMIDEIVNATLGSGVRWPLGGEGNVVFEKFIQRFHEAAKSRGIKTV